MDSARPSIRDRVQLLDAGAEIVGAHVVMKRPVLVLASGEAVLADDRGRVVLHQGVPLATATDGQSLVTGGDDGRVMRWSPGSSPVELSRTERGTWVDHVAAGPNGAFAWTSGRMAFALRDGKTHTLALPSAGGGIAFFPKGYRVAIAHYNGASLWYPNASTAPEVLTWKGSHLGVTVSSDMRFVVTGMQENQLHGWRLSDNQHMRMSGYPGKVRSMSWTKDGRFLATSGAMDAILWPFTGKNGPMGVSPKMLAPAATPETRVSVVAGHPKADVVAVGFDDGMILLVRIDDGAEILLHPPGGSRVTAIDWRADGQMLVFGTESGEAGVANL